MQLMPKKMNPLIHFGLCNGNRSSPTVHFFTPDGVEVELRQAAREFFKDGGIEIDFTKRTVYLSRIFKWYTTFCIQYMLIFHSSFLFPSFQKYFVSYSGQNLVLPIQNFKLSIKQ